MVQAGWTPLDDDGAAGRASIASAAVTGRLSRALVNGAIAIHEVSRNLVVRAPSEAARRALETAGLAELTDWASAVSLFCVGDESSEVAANAAETRSGDRTMGWRQRRFGPACPDVSRCSEPYDVNRRRVHLRVERRHLAHVLPENRTAEAAAAPVHRGGS